MPVAISLRPYGAQDFALLEAVLGDPAMMLYMGDPETEESLSDCHAQYIDDNATEGGNRVFVILAEGAPSGTVGYWHHEHDGQAVWETGVSVLIAHQGQGIGRRALLAILDQLRADGRYALAYAYPMVENVASNVMCRNVGFALVGEDEFESPAGTIMRCNVWKYDLTH